MKKKDELERVQKHLQWQWFALGVIAGMSLSGIIIGLIDLIKGG